MATTATGLIWIFTNADESATPFSTDKPLDFECVRWVGGQIGDTVVLQDQDGNVVWESIAEVSDFVDESAAPLRCNGLIIATIDAGTLYLYHRINV